MLDIAFHIFIRVRLIAEEAVHLPRIRIGKFRILEIRCSADEVSRRDAVPDIEIVSRVIAPKSRAPAMFFVVVIKGKIQRVPGASFKAFVRLPIAGIKIGIAELDAEVPGNFAPDFQLKSLHARLGDVLIRIHIVHGGNPRHHIRFIDNIIFNILPAACILYLLNEVIIRKGTPNAGVSHFSIEIGTPVEIFAVLFPCVHDLHIIAEIIAEQSNLYTRLFVELRLQGYIHIERFLRFQIGVPLKEPAVTNRRCRIQRRFVHFPVMIELGDARRGKTGADIRFNA